jgi:hypothetical protein
MRNLFLLCLFSIIIGIDSFSQSLPDKLVLEAVNRGTYTFQNQQKGPLPPFYYNIELSLHNKTQKTCEFLTYNCTPMGNLLIDSKKYKVCAPICTGNTIMPIKLKADQTFCIKVLIQTDVQEFNDSIRVGWIYLNYDNTKDVDDFHKKLGQAHSKNTDYVIWSKKLNFRRDYSDQIEVKDN